MNQGIALHQSLEAQKRLPLSVQITPDVQFYAGADALELLLDLPREDWHGVSEVDVLRKAEEDSAGISTERLRELCDLPDSEFAQAPEVNNKKC